MSASSPSDVSEDKVVHFSDRSMRRLLSDPGYVKYLVELVAPELLGHLDFDSGVQQNRSFIAETLRQREADVLLRVPFQASIAHEALHICILIEHQSRPEWLMRLRMLIYMIRIWEDEYRQLEARTEDQQPFSPILPILFYTGSDRWTAPLPLTEVFNVPEILQRFVPTFDVLFLDVKRTDSQTLTQSGHLFGWLLRVLQEEHADEQTFRNALETAAAEISQDEAMRPEQFREALNYLILLVLHQRHAHERDTFIDLIKEHSPDEREIEIMAQTAAEALIEQGIERGARQMSIENTLTILAERFPGADVPAVKSRLEAIGDLNRLKQLTRNALSAESFHAFREALET